ncbi:MAG: peptidoglycan DD-metalloendopeptidase family protein [Chloroflexi bacterium]|nr:peptidoglycan DD-metalloendopeptidase family protein [Chloroflexota bacterium]
MSTKWRWRVLLWTVLFFLALSLFGGGLSVVGTEVEDLKTELEDYKAQLSEVQAKLDETSGYHSDLLNELDAMNAQMYGLEADFSFYQGKTEEVTLNIEQISGSIQSKDAEGKVIAKELEESQAILAQRIATLYKLNRGKYLQILLSSSDFQQFGARLTYFQRVFREDQSLLQQTKELISQMNDQRNQLQEQNDLLKSQREEYAYLQGQTSQAQQQLDSEMAPKKADLVVKAEEQAALEGEKSELVQNIQADQDYIAKLLSTHTFVYTGETGSSGLAWPIGGSITSYFGWRDWGDFHRGIDIGASYGVPVAAAAGGVVVTADYLGTYGNIVILDHLNGISTVYAHLSGFAVDTGEEVEQGQVVGWIGLTGLTTGPHLHFEVRVSGDFVNPLDWLP